VFKQTFSFFPLRRRERPVPSLLPGAVLGFSARVRRCRRILPPHYPPGSWTPGFFFPRSPPFGGLFPTKLDGDGSPFFLRLRRPNQNPFRESTSYCRCPGISPSFFPFFPYETDETRRYVLQRAESCSKKWPMFFFFFHASLQHMRMGEVEGRGSFVFPFFSRAEPNVSGISRTVASSFFFFYLIFGGW